MQEYFTTIRHQSTVQRLGTQDIYLRVIYSHVLSFTQSDGGWTGTYQDMACQILLSPSTICRALNRLLQSGLVRRQGSNTYVAVIDRNTSSTVAVSNEPVAGGNQSVAGSNSPDNPYLLILRMVTRRARIRVTHPLPKISVFRSSAVLTAHEADGSHHSSIPTVTPSGVA